jgi:hypothetical protein
MNRFTSASIIALLVGFVARAADEAKDPKEQKFPVVTDAGGKEVVLKKWKMVGGTRQLGWIAAKPEVFDVREVGSTTFKDGVTTFVPVSRVQGIKYEYDKETCAIQIAGLDKPLTGTTKYKDINVITIEAEVDQGKSGVADLRYRGGVIKGGIKEIKFPDAKAPEAPPAKGELFSFLIVPEAKGKSGVVMTASNVQALYRFGDGSEKPLSWLMFKKTLKVEIADIRSMHVGDFNVKEKTAECEVQLKDGMQLSVTLLTSVSIDGKPATLVGLLGDVPAGWKLFPVHTFQEFQPGELKVDEDPKKKEPPKKKGPTKDE